VARTWLSIRVDLVDGGGRTPWPRPGRVFAAARSHSFAQLATAIDDAFARWDRAHLHMFDLGGVAGLLIDRYWDDPPDNSRVDDTVKLGTLTGGQRFVYVFDLGDDWAHLCTVNPERIDPLHTVGITRTGRRPTGAGAPSPTSTVARGTATTAKPRHHRTPNWPTYPPFTPAAPTRRVRNACRCSAEELMPPRTACERWYGSVSRSSRASELPGWTGQREESWVRAKIASASKTIFSTNAPSCCRVSRLGPEESDG